MKEFYKQRLPHIQPIGATFFVTFRLYDSVPRKKLDDLRSKYENQLQKLKSIVDLKEKNFKIFNLRKGYLLEYDDLLDKVDSGAHFLKDERIRDIVAKELHRFDGQFYDLIAYCIMSNHVHLLIDTSLQIDSFEDEKELTENYAQLDVIMKRIKGPSASYANKALARTGKFWNRESYDIYIRNEKMLNNVIAYILDNPVKAGLANDWQVYPGSFYKYAA